MGVDLSELLTEVLKRAVGRVQWAAANPRHFLVMAGVGLDARTVYGTSAGAKRIRNESL
jgi:diacylglycerol kinase family enzyme